MVPWPLAVERDVEAPSPYALLEARLGYAFAQPSLLERALTHKSFLNERPQAVAAGREDNERLEFLGDALLGVTIGHLLMETFPERSEGELSKARAQLVSESGLAAVAHSLGLGDWLFLGRGEEQTGGRRKPSLLADACEAVMAAIFLDGGYPQADAAVRRHFLAAVAAVREAGGLDFKTRLQERVQSLHRSQPRYQLLGAHGPDHDKTFEVAVSVGERELGRGKGPSKKQAEQRAAELALTRLDEDVRALAR